MLFFLGHSEQTKYNLFYYLGNCETRNRKDIIVIQISNNHLAAVVCLEKYLSMELFIVA